MRLQLRPYAIAFLTWAIALLFTWLLQPLMSPTIFALFYPAVMVSALEGGLRAGLLSIVLAAFATKYFFLPPLYSLAFTSPNTFFRFTLLVLVGFAIGLLSTALRTAKQRNEVSLSKLQRSEEKYRQIVDLAIGNLSLLKMSRPSIARSLDYLTAESSRIFPPTVTIPRMARLSIVSGTTRFCWMNRGI